MFDDDFRAVCILSCLHCFALASASGGASLLCVTAVQEKNCGWCSVAVGRLLHVCGLERRYGRGYEEADGAWNDRCGVVVMMSVMAMAMLVVMMMVCDGDEVISLGDYDAYHWH